MAHSKIAYVLIAIFIFSLFLGCSRDDKYYEIGGDAEDEDEPKVFNVKKVKALKGYNEVTKTDVLEIDNISGDEISVLGLRIGHSSRKLLDKLGEPDILTGYAGNTIFNAEYGSAIGLEEIGVIFNIEDDEIKRMTLLMPFNQYLKGTTKFDTMTKYEVYARYHIPDRQIEEPRTRVFYYDETGIDFVLDGKEVKGISFRSPEKMKDTKDFKNI